MDVEGDGNAEVGGALAEERPTKVVTEAIDLLLRAKVPWHPPLQCGTHAPTQLVIDITEADGLLLCTKEAPMSIEGH